MNALEDLKHQISILDVVRRDFDSLLGVSTAMLLQMRVELEPEVRACIDQNAAARKNGYSDVMAHLAARGECGVCESEGKREADHADEYSGRATDRFESSTASIQGVS